MNAPIAYLTVAEADEYFATKLKSTAWTGASSTDKQNSLYEATRLMERLVYQGVKSNQYNNEVLGQALIDQPLEFPRNGLAEIPDGIKIACCECAIAILNGFDIEEETRGFGVITDQFASVRQTRREDFIQPYLLAGIPSALAWSYLSEFLADPRSIRLTRSS